MQDQLTLVHNGFIVVGIDQIVSYLRAHFPTKLGAAQASAQSFIGQQYPGQPSTGPPTDGRSQVQGQNQIIRPPLRAPNNAPRQMAEALLGGPLGSEVITRNGGESARMRLGFQRTDAGDAYAHIDSIHDNMQTYDRRW